MIAVTMTYARGCRTLRSSIAEKKENDAPTCFFDPSEVDGCCDICFGEVERMLFVRECTCGRIFHDECASMTDECPYCHTPYRDMGMRRVRRMDCPRCGRPLKDSICRCGAVLPKGDGTFMCSCGNIMHMGSGECRICGSRYAVTQI